MSPDSLSAKSLLFLAKGSGKRQASKTETFRCKEPYFRKHCLTTPIHTTQRKMGSLRFVLCETVTTCPTTP